MIVPLLAITGYDLANDTLSGIATPSTRVTVVGPCSLEDCSNPAEIQVVADGDGNWRAYFDDVQPGEGYEAQIYDMDADHTVLRDWSVPFNQPPVADAGPNQTAYFNQVIALDASASYDPEADALTFEWDLDNDGAYDDASGITATTSFNQTGDHVIGLQVTDSGGLSDADTLTITILPWTLAGFYQPVDMNGVYNIVKGGSTVPFKFEIFAGPTELTSTSSMKSFAYVQISCDANAFTDQIETVVTGISGLRYDNAAGQFIYNWKTPVNAGNCYRVTMTTMDDSSLVAFFRLK
jgi:hypothetical protein